MSRSIVATILILVAVGLFFGYIDPKYEELRAAQEESRQFDEALDKSKELQAIRDELLTKYNTFSSEDLERIEKLLPDHVDNVRLILDLDGIASKYGMLIRNVNLSKESAENPNAIGPDDRPYGSIKIDFTMVAPYEDFLKFMKDLEKSLRLVDLETLSFRVLDTSNELLEYNVGVRTYWLK